MMNKYGSHSNALCKMTDKFYNIYLETDIFQKLRKASPSLENGTHTMREDNCLVPLEKIYLNIYRKCLKQNHFEDNSTSPHQHLVPKMAIENREKKLNSETNVRDYLIP